MECKGIAFTFFIADFVVARDREKKEQEVADNGFVTNPETDSPILVRMKLSVYDFGKGGARADADEADDAPAPSKKEGK